MLEIVFLLTAYMSGSRETLKSRGGVALSTEHNVPSAWWVYPFLHLFAASFHTLVLILCTNY